MDLGVNHGHFSREKQGFHTSREKITAKLIFHLIELIKVMLSTFILSSLFTLLALSLNSSIALNRGNSIFILMGNKLKQKPLKQTFFGLAFSLNTI
jgi:hypothetical protein